MVAAIGVFGVVVLVIGALIFLAFIGLLVGARSIRDVPIPVPGRSAPESAVEDRAAAEFDDDQFDLWLASNKIQTAGLPDATIARLRQRFLESQS